MTGWTSAQALGKPAADLLPPSREGPRRFERPDGSQIEIAVSSSPWKGRDGGLLGTVIVLRDMSLQYRAHLALDRASRLEALGVRAGGLVHDINNVLAALFTSLQLARLKAQNGDPSSTLLPDLDPADPRLCQGRRA